MKKYIAQCYYRINFWAESSNFLKANLDLPRECERQDNELD